MMQKIAPNDIVMQLCCGFWASRCLHVAAELGLADHIDETPRAVAELAVRTASDPDALARILRLLAMHGLFAASDAGYEHTEASQLLRSDHPRSMRPYVRMIGADFGWSAFGFLEHTVRTGAPSMEKVFPGGLFAYLGQHPDMGRVFNDAMAAKSHADIAAIIPSYDFSNFGTVADIGGGRGHLLKAVIDSNPGVRGILFDLPLVVTNAASIASDRLILQGGDFFKDALPRADAYLLSTVLHDWSDTEAGAILSAVRRVIPSTGKLLLFEFVMPEGPGFHRAKALDINMLVLTGGRERTESEYARLLATAGFRLARAIQTPGPISILEAEPVQ
jgi:hypothetical protein